MSKLTDQPDAVPDSMLSQTGYTPEVESIPELLKTQYGLEAVKLEKSGTGAGSDTWFVTCQDGKYVVNYPSQSEMNHPELEPKLCAYLNQAGISACRFLKNHQGNYLTADGQGRIFHVQRFIPGTEYQPHTAPDWLLTASAGMLGKIHTALRDYAGLPVGIGKDFFRFMTPERALQSYRRSLSIARTQQEPEIAAELEYRIALMHRFPGYSFDLRQLTCQSTHGDYFISQLRCGDHQINGVIDWTTACVHPVVWEIIRSFVYAAPSCRDGQIDTAAFLAYLGEYRKYAKLNSYDLLCMVRLFYYQIAVCDYYGQYFASQADNRNIYLFQARFSTKLLRWLENHVETLTAEILVACDHCWKERSL